MKGKGGSIDDSLQAGNATGRKMRVITRSMQCYIDDARTAMIFGRHKGPLRRSAAYALRYFPFAASSSAVAATDV
jgi:hypothetical protein